MNNSPTARDTRPQPVRSATARDPKPFLVPSKANTRLLPKTNVLHDFTILKGSSSCSKAINNINLDHGRTAKHEGKSKPVQVAPHNAAWVATTGGPEQKNVSLSKPVFSVSLTRTLSDRRKIASMQGTDTLLNLWTPTPLPATLHRVTPMAQYNINSKLPFHILETDQIRLEPLVVSIDHKITQTRDQVLTPARQTSRGIHVASERVLGCSRRHGSVRDP